MIDPTRSQIDLQVTGGAADEEEEEEEEGKFPSSVLKDLHMVRQPHVQVVLSQCFVHVLLYK